MKSIFIATPIFKQPAVLMALLATLGGTAILVNAANDAPATTTKPALTVTVTRPEASELSLNLRATGNVAAWQETVIGAEVNGLRLTDVRVNVGDVVKRGQVLAGFAADSVEAELAVQRASIAEAEAALAEANANAARAKTLETTGAMSAQQINQYTTAAATAEARLAAARAAAQSVSIRLRNTRVLAPDGGVISARPATVGAVVQAGQELFRLIRNNRLEWRAEVTATELNKVKPAQIVTISTAAGDKVSGKVRIIAPTIDPQTRNALVYVDLPIGAAARAGMFATGDFALGQSSGLTVPQQAVVVRDGFSFVFSTQGKESGQTTVKQIKVTTGRRVGERLEILDGIEKGQVIVAAGAGFLNEGDTVAIAQSLKKPAPPRVPAGLPK